MWYHKTHNTNEGFGNVDLVIDRFMVNPKPSGKEESRNELHFD